VWWTLERRLFYKFIAESASDRILTSISCRWQTCAMHCVRANVLQTKVDAQCDKLATELSWQRLRWSTFSSYSKLFVKSHQFWPTHLHLVPPLGVTPFEYPFEFCRDLQHQKTRVPGLSCGFVCMILCLAISVEVLVKDRQTDRYTTTAYTALAWHRAVKIGQYLLKLQVKMWRLPFYGTQYTGDAGL